MQFWFSIDGDNFVEDSNFCDRGARILLCCTKDYESVSSSRCQNQLVVVYCFAMRGGGSDLNGGSNPTHCMAYISPQNSGSDVDDAKVVCVLSCGS